MSGLSSLLAKLEQGLGDPADRDFPAISSGKNTDLERQHIDKKGFSSVSRVSSSQTDKQDYPEENRTQARASAGAQGRAHEGYVRGLETLETLETPAGAGAYLSSSLSNNLEKLEKSRATSPLLAQPLPVLPEEAAALDERAGFLEFDCGLSRAEAERQALDEFQATLSAETGIPVSADQAPAPALPEQDGLPLWHSALAGLTPHRAPCAGYRGEEWPRTLARARTFLDRFGEQAEALGWTAPRLFGVHPEAGIGRVDHCGALVLPIGGPVLAITATEIRFSHLTHRTKPGQPEGVPIWEIGR